MVTLRECRVWVVVGEDDVVLAVGSSQTEAWRGYYAPSVRGRSSEEIYHILTETPGCRVVPCRLVPDEDWAEFRFDTTTTGGEVDAG